MAKNGTHIIPVRYNTIGINTSSVRLSISIEKGDLTLAQAAKLLVGSQLSVLAKCDPNSGDDSDGQETFEDMDLSVGGVVTSRRVSVHDNGFSASLYFEKSAVNTNELGRFTNCRGKLEVERIGDAPDSGTKSDDESDEEPNDENG